MLISPHTLRPIPTNKEKLLLTRGQVQWFLSGPSFLANVEHLHTVGVIPYCAICAHVGQEDTVQVVMDGGRGVWVVGSPCRRGEITMEKARSISLTELLANLGWRLRCGLGCEPPMDGVEGANAPTDGTLTVSCGCTDRIFPMPAVGHA